MFVSFIDFFITLYSERNEGICIGCSFVWQIPSAFN